MDKCKCKGKCNAEPEVEVELVAKASEELTKSIEKDLEQEDKPISEIL